MVEVKICGLQRFEDIEYANKLKPDYIGLVFAKSRRQVDPIFAKKLIDRLDKKIKKVGVFLNHSTEEVENIRNICNLDILQFHGEESPSYCEYFRQEVWKAFSIKDKKDLYELERYRVNKYLLDTWVEGEAGGTGRVFDWKIVGKVSKPIVLAGGLHSQNIRKAIDIVNPTVVDVSSGVEVHGYKNYERMAEFIKNTRSEYDE